MPPRPTIAQVKRVTAKLYGVPEAWMETEDRRHDASKPRQVGMYLARRLTRHSFTVIGKRFGGKHSSTVQHAYRDVQHRIFRSRETEAQIGLLIDTINAGVS